MGDGNVVDLQRVRDERAARQDQHTVGETVCLGCRHTWHGVIPCSTNVVECPSCHTMKGVRATLVGWDLKLWTCRTDGCSDNQYLHLTKSGPYCPHCGTMWPWDEVLETIRDA